MNHAEESAPGNTTRKHSGKSEEELSGFIWRTFAGNKKKEDFLKSSVLLLIVINGLLGFFLYNQNTEPSVYVIDAGVPKLANLMDSGKRVDAQVVFFLKVWTKLLMEVNSDNYEENREALKKLSSQALMQRILTSESSSGNRLIKEIMQSETMSVRIADLIIDEIQGDGATTRVTFTEVIQIDVPDGSEQYVTQHTAEIINTSYSLNGVGMAMIDIDNIWTLERRAD